MQQTIAYIQANGNEIYRHPGGFWAKKNWNLPEKYYGTMTIQSLVSRGILKYTEWKENKRGQFPVKAEMNA